MVLMRASMLITFQSISSLSGESGDEKEEWSKHGQLVTDQSGKEIITMIFITVIIITATTIIRNGMSMLERVVRGQQQKELCVLSKPTFGKLP